MTERVFQIRIHLSGAAMQDGADVAPELRKIADLVEPWGRLYDNAKRPITDANGNTVGAWSIVEEQYIA